MPSAGLSCLWNFLGVLFMTQIWCRCVLPHICLFPPSSVEQHLRAGMRRREGVCTLCGRGGCEGWVVVHLLSSSWCVEEERRKLEKKTCSSGSSLQWEVSESLPSRADMVLSEETRKNKDGPYPQGAHSLLSCLSDSPTRLWAPGGQALVFIWNGVYDSELSFHCHHCSVAFIGIIPAMWSRLENVMCKGWVRKGKETGWQHFLPLTVGAQWSAAWLSPWCPGVGRS